MPAQRDSRREGDRDMDTAPLRTARSTYDIYREHLNTVYRVAFTYMKNPFDAEDAAQ